MNDSEKYLIVGLGNPGRTYQHTRHNVGFELVSAFAGQHGMTFKHETHLLGQFSQGVVHGKKTMLLMPATFMNASGDAVRQCVDYFKVPLDHLVVISDDVALPLGTIRVRSKGSSGGHNGLESIRERLGTEYYARLKIGVGGPGEQILADYVLGRFSVEESLVIEQITPKVVSVLDLWIGSGIAAAMQVANNKEEVKKVEENKNG